MTSTARELVEHHAAMQAPERRRELGSHATPALLARTLVDVGIEALGHLPERVVDPSCGAGAFLIAAADSLVDAGVAPGDVPRRLAGCDVDPVAVDHCLEALRRWVQDHGCAPSEPAVIVHDPLSAPLDLPPADLVVGNPPFLAQRTLDTARGAAARTSLRARFGELGPYVDAAAAFLLVAAEALGDGGVAVMLLPQSVLAARDASAVRRRVLESCDLVSLWADDVRHFDADVDVCAPLLRRRPTGRPASLPGGAGVELRWGSVAERIGAAPTPVDDGSWAPLLAHGLGVPTVAPTVCGEPARDAAARGAAAGRARTGGGTTAGRRVAARTGATRTTARRTIGDVATTTAGFRDEFYALAAAGRVDGDHGWRPDGPPLVTVGMIDVCRLDRTTPRRLAGRRVVDPRLDLDALADASPGVARWTRARLVPKVLVATQTKVPEAVADPTGILVPVTPVLSIEPHADAGLDVWHLAAALCAPQIAASVVRDRAGSGLSIDSVRLSAPSLRSVALPTDRSAWQDGAELAARLHSCSPDERRPLLEELATVMSRAHEQAPDPVLVAWWLERSVSSARTVAPDRA